MKSSVSHIILLAILTFVQYSHADTSIDLSPRTSGSPDPLVEFMADRVLQDTVLSTLYRLEDFVTRNSFTDSCVEAGNYISAKFTSFGLDDVSLLPFDTTYASNVAGELRGRTYPDKYFIICAHYDATAGNIYEPEPVAPGADDNGSGTAVVMESARILSKFEFDYSLRFVCFAGEEQFTVGSRHYANAIHERGDDILGVFNFDMVGYPVSGEPTFEIFFYEDSEPLTDLLIAVAKKYTSLIPVKNNRRLEGADQYPFYLHGYPALLCHEGQGYPWYHTVDDTVGNLDVTYLTEMTRLAVTTMAELSIPVHSPTPPPPSFTATPSDESVLLAWEETPEHYLDPSFDMNIFEGYRIYRSEMDKLNFHLLAQFDLPDFIGFDTGLAHMYHDGSVRNGIPYYYSIVSFNWFGHESSRIENITSAIPVVSAATSLDNVRVIPNPFRGDEFWTRSGWGERIRFTNLPTKATVKVFTLGGDLVKTIHHTDAFSGSVDWTPGEVAGGVYIYVIDSPVGTRIGKLVIIK